MGQRQLSLKGSSAVWRGVTRLSTVDRGERHFTKLENCYISSDGQEIRHFPGYATFLDLTEINNPQGYSKYQIDTLRPLTQLLPAGTPYTTGVSASYHAGNQALVSSPNQTLQQTHISRCKPAHVWAFEQINNEIVLIGESRFREDPVYPSPYTSPNDVLTVSSVEVTVSNTFSIQLNADIGGPGGNLTTRPFNYLYEGQTVFVDGVRVADATLQADIDAKLNGKVHRIGTGGVSGDTVSLTTVSSVAPTTEAATAGELHHIRYARFGKGSYDPNSPRGPYGDELLKRPDDPDALTVWRVRDQVDPYDSTTQNLYSCDRSEVCNRQRDWGDSMSFGTGQEGILVNGSPDVAPTPNSKIGLSRREQRKLPYRPHIECAADRIILAVPQYGCMFHVPMRAPVISSDYLSPRDSNYDAIPAIANDIYDRPRALGIPKPRLIESVFSTPVSPPFWSVISPTDAQKVSVSSNVFPVGTPPILGTGINPSPNSGLPNGEYKVAISFEDPGTGEEGLASETMTVQIGLGANPETIWINYIHPGYHFPEAAAWKLNVYLALPGQEALAFYGQYDLQAFPRDYGTDTNFYGLDPTTPEDNLALTVRFALPVEDNVTTPGFGSALDPTRLAPQSATMPRGASVCKMIRGVLFAGGALGNAGPDLQLWRARASSRFQPGSSVFSSNDQMFIRAHDWNSAVIGYGDVFTDMDPPDTTLGIAGRCFPDAYQGIDFINNTGQYPGRDTFKKVSKVLNRQAIGEREMTGSPDYASWKHRERLELQRPAYDRQKTAGAVYSSTPNQSAYGQPIYYVMPRGQLQIGDPGAPHRSSRAFIKIVDANKGDDITAIGQVGGSAVVCTRKETYSYSWYVAPSSSQPNLMSNEFGCIASNSMVEFDGGLAWLSDRGPVAMGTGLQYVGAHVGEDFYSNERRYIRDSRGMMRHSWGAHDAARGLIIWGLITRDATHTIDDEGRTFTPQSALAFPNDTGDYPQDYGDQVLSRFPCDEMLIWNYRVNAFSTWRPPAGLEVYWMRPIRDANGAVRMAFLAADQRIYVLNDEWGDANGVFNTSIVATAVGRGAETTTLTMSVGGYQDGDTLTEAGQGRNWNVLLKPGVLIEFLDARGNIVSETTVNTVTSTDPTGTGTGNCVVELSAPQTWRDGQEIRVGARQRATIVTNYMGSGSGKMSVSGVSMRYRLFPHQEDGSYNNSSANAKVVGYKSDDGTYDGAEARVVPFTREGQWEGLGYPQGGSTMPAEIEQLGRRKTFSEGRADAEEIAFQIQITGQKQTRIQDILLEVDG